MLHCGKLQTQDVASSDITFFLGHMDFSSCKIRACDTSPHSRRDLSLFLLRMTRFQHLCNANRAETQLLVWRSCDVGRCQKEKSCKIH